ncbi:Heavy-metal-associated domain-containing protein [Lutibacter oricola]|uniref:Heavy-metal-associated domain-containing protein n=1 Tax=Lutibacter oricola TaxID=762486 RepID=A0A1H3C338_9FLAO|nr:cation transporter [Lutibacter oricola]SDX48475.1 Heavy-metal-associated domain-containing protein [Lutibacter oricola]
MKKILLIIGILFISISTQAQEKKKNARTSFEVNGVCEMCKDRIEKATLKTKGVKFCSWSIETHQLSVIYDQRKLDELTIHKNIAAVGHDTKKVKATDEAYNNLHHCCKYNREKPEYGH